MIIENGPITKYDDSKSVVANATSWAREARVRLKYIIHQPPLDLLEAITECYRLVTAGAVLLSGEDHRTIMGSAYFEIEAMDIDLMDVNDRSPGRFSHALSFALMPLVRIARKRLRPTFDKGTEDIIEQLINDHSSAYFAADPDINPSWMMRQLWLLFDAITAHETGDIIVQVTAIVAELNSVQQPLSFTHHHVDYEAIARKNAPVAAPTLRFSKTKRDAKPSFDQTPRINRLAARLSALKAAGGPDDQIHRLQEEIGHLTGDGGGIDPSRLYPEGVPG